MEKLNALLSRYSELHRVYGHAPRDHAQRPAFDNAQRELWAIAQAICQLTNPKIQRELDAARRDAVAQIRLHVTHVSPAEVRPLHRQRPIRWPDFQLTPELSIDPTTTGACVTTDVLKRLRIAHKNQISTVMSVLHNHRRDFNTC